MIEKSNEFNIPLFIGYIDHETAFDSVEHEAIFKALQTIAITFIAIVFNALMKPSLLFPLAVYQMCSVVCIVNRA